MADTSFMDDVIFPTDISRGSVGGPDWPAEIVAKSNGREERNTRWSAPLRTYDARYGVRTPNEAYGILKLYMAAMGRMRGFRYLDWSDWKTCAPATVPAFTNQVFGVGNGVATAFQLSVTYDVAGHTFVRPITKPFGAPLIGKNGVLQTVTTHYTINAATGIVTFTAPPANGHDLTWGGTFHVPVRFDCKLDQVELQGPIENIPSIFLKELRL